MAKAKAKSPKRFLTELATNPEQLGKFIHDPEGAMDAAGIKAKDRAHIRNSIAQHVHKQLSPVPDSYFVVF